MSSSSTQACSKPSIFRPNRLIWPTVWNTYHTKPTALSPLSRSPSPLPIQAADGDRLTPTPDLTTSPTTSESSLPSTFSDFVRSGSSRALNSDYVKQIFRQDLIANQVICAGAYFGRELEATTARCEVERGQAGLLRQSDGHTPQGIECATDGVYGYGSHQQAYGTRVVVELCNACAGAPFIYGQDRSYQNGAQVQDTYPQAFPDTTTRIVDYDQCDDYCQYNSLDSGMAPLPRYLAQPMFELNPNASVFVPTIAIRPPPPTIEVSSIKGSEDTNTNVDAAPSSLHPSGPLRSDEKGKKELVVLTKRAEKRRNEIKIVMGSGWSGM